MRKILVLLAFFALSLPMVWAAAQPGSALVKLVPRDGAYAGWKRREAPRFFGRENLFEHINGAANAYLDEGFQGCATADFLPGGKGRDFITTDIYDMGTPEAACTMFRKEACKSRTARVGSESCGGPDHLNFRKGRYYVKLTASTSKKPFPAALVALARKTAAAIPGR